MNSSKLLTGIFLTVLLSGCSHQSTKFVPAAPDNDLSDVYLYRPNSLSNVVISPVVLVNGNKTEGIKNNTYIQYQLVPGKHSFELEVGERFDGNKQISVNLQPGQVYFLRVDTELKFKKNDLYYRRFDILKVENSIALTEIVNCRNVNKDKTETVVTEGTKQQEKTKSGEEVYSISKSRNPFGKD